LLTEQGLDDLDQNYKALVFQKEEQLIAQEAESNEQSEEIKKLEATVKALELKAKEKQKEGR